MKQKGFADVLAIIGVVFILLTIPVTLSLVKQRQETRKQAQEAYPSPSSDSIPDCIVGQPDECNDSGGINYCSGGHWYSREANPGECGKPSCTCPNGAPCPDDLYSHCPSGITPPPTASCQSGATEPNDSGGVNFCKNGAWYSCPSGQTYENGECKAPPQPCSEGQTETNDQGGLNFCRGGNWFSCPVGQEYKNGNCVGLSSPSPSPTPPAGPVKCPYKTKADCETSGCPGTCDTCADGTVNCFTTPCTYSSLEECELSGCPSRIGALAGGCSRCPRGGVSCSQPLSQCADGQTETDSLGCSYTCKNHYMQKDDPNCKCNFEGTMPSAHYDPYAYVDKCTNNKIISAQCRDGTLSMVENKKDFSETKCPSGKCHDGQCVAPGTFCCDNDTAVCSHDSNTNSEQQTEKCPNGISCTNGYCLSQIPSSCKPTVFSDGCLYDCIPLIGANQGIIASIFQKSDPTCQFTQKTDFVCKDKDIYSVTYGMDAQGQKTSQESFVGSCPEGCNNGSCAPPENSPCQWDPWTHAYIDDNNNLVECAVDKNTNQASWQKVNLPIKVSLPKGLTNAQRLNIYDSLYRLYNTPLSKKVETKELIIYDKVKNVVGFDDPDYKTSGGRNYRDLKIATLYNSSDSNWVIEGIFHELGHGITTCGLNCNNIVDVLKKWKKETGWTTSPNPNNSGMVNIAPFDAPTKYAKSNEDEDLAESTMLFMTNPSYLQKVSPRRYNFIKNYWNEGQEAPGLTQ